ncbi:hypothetical protein MKD33_17810, partial [Chromobacterium piscinae]
MPLLFNQSPLMAG